MDNDTWQVKSGLTHLWQGSLERELKELHSATEAYFFYEQVNDVASLQGDSDFDEIDSMRILSNLFYKLEKNSKEFEKSIALIFTRRNVRRKMIILKKSKRRKTQKPKSSLRLLKMKSFILHILLMIWMLLAVFRKIKLELQLSISLLVRTMSRSA